ncbi:MAG: FAD-dependent monooxygenase [Dinghuibacter sp.]|nr:FAD-dependent monooxygenase [Dinghuibacter sp.]
MNDKKLAIIGGGIAGLTFAHCLANKGYEMHIFEKKEHFGEVGAAISIFPNALCVMDELGLLHSILQNSGQFKTVYLKTSRGTILSKSEPKSDYPVICLHRADLHTVLLKDVPATLYNNYSLNRLTHLENGQICLTFNHGEERVFDAVIGADGVHSVVRKHIINDGEPVFRGYNVWRGIVRSNFDVGYASETYGKGKRVGIVPIKQGLYGWWATCNEAYMQGDAPESAKEKLGRLFGNWHYPIPELISNTEHILKNGIMDRKPVKGWTKGNATLIGDAAHPTTPNLGQGGCTAIEGAYILAKAIQKYGLTPKAFNTYEAMQYPRSKSIVQASLRLGKLGQMENPLLSAIRNFAFKITPSAIAIKMLDKYFSYRVTNLEI